MDVNDAMYELIDTSDMEEKELLQIQTPGYYQRVWGETSIELEKKSEFTDASSFRHISTSPSSSLSPPPPFPPAIPMSPLPPAGPIPHAYPLRNRSAIQLHPFEYEKRMYKRQLRGLPEAIVTDPTRATGRKERYLHEEEEDTYRRMQGSGIAIRPYHQQESTPVTSLHGSESNLPVEALPHPSPLPIFLGQSSTPGSSELGEFSTTPAAAGQLRRVLEFDFAADDARTLELGSGTGGNSSPVSPIIVDDIEDGETRGTFHRSQVENDVSGDGQMSSEESSAVEMTAKDRKRLKVMGRMMPAILMRKLLVEEQGRLKKRRKNTDPHSDDNESDRDSSRPLQPGRGRKRLISPSSMDPKRYEIQGDPETDSEGKHDVPTTTHQEIIVVEDSGDSGSGGVETSLEQSEEGTDGDNQTWLAPNLGDELGRCVSELPPAPRKRRSDYERDRPRGGDLIDRMLQRTKLVGPRSKPPKPHKTNASGIQRLSSGFKFDIVTGSARRRGAVTGQQTKLTFPRADKQQQRYSSVGPSVPLLPQYQDPSVHRAGTGKKTKKRARKAVQTRLYVIEGHGQKIISGRRRQILHINDDDHAFHEALAPEGHKTPTGIFANNDRRRARNRRDILEKFRDIHADDEPDTFDGRMKGNQKYSHVTLDFDLPLLPSGIKIAAGGYIDKGRLAQLVSILKNDSESLRPLAVTTFEQEIDPDAPMTQLSSMLAAVCDHLYDASIVHVDDPELPLKMKASEVTMYQICQLVSYRTCGADDQDGQLATAVSEQMAHLVGRINERLELVSADGHILDPRSFALYWFAMELELRVAIACQKRKASGDNPVMMLTTAAERYAVLLLRRLLEYGLHRTLRPLQNLTSLENASHDVRTIEIWVCFSHVAPFFGQTRNGQTATSPFWRMVEASMEAQSNKPDVSLDASEQIWRTIFGLCTLSQISVYGLTTSTVRLEPYWPMVSKALKSIRLCADETLDHSKPASTLKKRDKYVRLVTARCLLLDIRYGWRLHDADLVFRELCSIFRSRKFSNLLGEPPDFPTFIRERDEPLFNLYTETDTAYGLFLKMIVRAFEHFPATDVAGRTRKLAKLLGIAVPVSSLPFTKASPPVGQELSMLYNRYSAIFVAIYTEPTLTNIHHRLQQVRLYITFKDADYDSQAASIRAMMYLAILLRHLDQSLDDVLSWASEMMNDLLDKYNAMDHGVSDLKGNPEAERDGFVLLIQLVLGSIRMVIENPKLNRSEPRAVDYPDVALLRPDWIGKILATPSLSGDHLTGIEIRKCVQSFLAARRMVIPPPPISKVSMYQVESQDEYGDSGIDLDDPAVLALLDFAENTPDETYVADKKAASASTIMNYLAKTPICRLVFQHLGQDVNLQYPGSYFHESDQWIDCWLGCASVAVRNHEADWPLYMTLWQATCQVIKSELCRRRVFMRMMITLLGLDPGSYNLFEDELLQVWFESIVSLETTIGRDFSVQLFSVCGLRHVLFRNFPCSVDIGTGMVTLENAEFERLRQSFIEIAISNVAENLQSVNAERHISYLVLMLKSLRGCLESTDELDPNRVKYAELHAFVNACIGRHEGLRHAHTLQAALSSKNS